MVTHDLPRTRFKVPWLAKGECHIWIADLQTHADHSVLSADEVQRSRRLLDTAAQRRSATSRALLRQLCAAYTGAAPGEVRFTYGHHGKPALEHPSQQLHFNVSHTGNLVLYAFTTDRAVGIDVEEIRPVTAFDPMMRDFFSIADQQWIRTGDKAQQTHRFFHCWTRMEARAKATGEGLQRTWEQTDGSRIQHLPIVDITFAPTPTSIASVAFSGGDAALSLHQLPAQ